jgi:hypothetical protein
MIVLSWSRATRDLLKSFGWGIRALHQLATATMVPFPRRLPIPISPLEEAGFEPSVPRQGMAFLTEENELYPLPITHQVGDHASGEKRLSRGRRTRCQRLRSLH